MAISVHILSPVCGLLFNVGIQLLVCRYNTKTGLLKSVFIGFFCGFLFVCVIEGYYYLTSDLLFTAFSGQLALNLITYMALGYCYFHFINLGETARRIRIVREIWDSHEGLSHDQLIKRYDASEIISVRLRRMITNGQIILRKDRYYIGKPLLLYMAKVIVLMKLFLLNRRSEFK